MPATSFRLCCHLLFLFLALASQAGSAWAQEPVEPQPVEELGCPQLQFAVETPELALDDKVVLNADEVSLERGGLSQLAGMVTLRQGDKLFSAEELSFDDTTRIVTVKSESLFRNPNLIVKSQEARFDLNAESGVFLDTEFSLPSRSARGDSDSIELNTDGQVRLKGASYTTCGVGSNAWYVQAADIRLDHEKGLGSARNARLRFLGVPILYTPYLQFPIDDRRRTGLLYPTFGQLSGAGFDFRWPVYVNLAANYDAVFTPRFLSERGLQSGLDFRYLLKSGQGNARYEYLDDRKFEKDRSLFRLDHQSLVNRRLGLEAVYAETSDRTYFEDLGGTLSSTSITHLEQTARLTYQAPASYRLTAMVQNFQPIASNLADVDDPYRRLPQVRFETLTRREFLNTRAGLGAEFVNFARDNSAEGARVVLDPYLRFERDAAAWYLRGQADVHHTRYELSGLPGNQSDQPERTLPVVSAEAGLNFERITDRGRLQTLTPRAFALYVPFDNQDELPLFDTGEPDFDFVQLFARNRFSGEDRLADARHVAGAATLRELDPATGRTRWSASVGQLYRIRAPRVSIPGLLPPEDGATEFIAQFDYHLTPGWKALIAGQWAPENNDFERTQLGLRYREPLGRRQLDLAYRYRRDLLEQADLSFLTPITGAWTFAARTRFSLADNESRENFVGVEYGTCCWALRVSHRRFISNTSGDKDSGVYVQLQLKGLANIGAGTDELLPDKEIDGDRPQ
ncbi:MAG: LPS-assembly protein LptD [Panacagrimonas sp.]